MDRNLQHARYFIKSHSIPMDLIVSSDLKDLLKSSVPPFPQYDLEDKIIQRSESKRTTHPPAPVHHETVPVEHEQQPPLQLQMPKKQEYEEERSQLLEQMQSLTRAPEATCHFYLDSMAWDLQGAIDMWKSESPVEPVRQPAMPAIMPSHLSKLASSQVSLEEERSQLVEHMKSLTHQDDSICRFFLETMAWDLQKAIDMWKGHSPRDR